MVAVVLEASTEHHLLESQSKQVYLIGHSGNQQKRERTGIQVRDNGLTYD